MARAPRQPARARRPRARTPASAPPGKRDFLSLADLTAAEIIEILDVAAEMKAHLAAGIRPPLLAGKTLAMIFQKPSLRTRVTFETGITQLGGSAIYLAPDDIRAGERESVADIANNLTRWVDIIVARTFEHDFLLELARSARIPVVNGLTDLLHPCQVLADCLTLREVRGGLSDCRVVFVGDGNNVAHSWLHAAACLDFHFTLACPPGYEPDPDILAWATRKARGSITVTHDVNDAIRGAEVIYTDVWTSMGQEDDARVRRQRFRPYQVNTKLVRRAAPNVLVMHCLPAHRGEEITAEVLDGPHSIVLDQAENRLHAQKGLLVWLFAASPAPRSRSGTARATTR